MHILYLGILMDHYLVKPQTHIKDDYLFAAADRGHVSSDLVVSADGYYFYFHIIAVFAIFLNISYFYGFTDFTVFPIFTVLPLSSQRRSRRDIQTFKPSVLLIFRPALTLTQG